MSRKTKVLVVGASGMLGSMILDVLSRSGDLDLVGTYCSRSPATYSWPVARLTPFNHKPSPVPDIGLGSDDWIVNAAGWIPQRGGGGDDLQLALDANVTLAIKLAGVASKTGARLLQIGTDCVFAGTVGGYKESDPHDGSSLYAKTKSLGEVPGSAILRCSIVGPEPAWSRKLGLLEWFLSHSPGATVSGYADCWWNGVTTLEFARVVEGLIRNPDLFWSGVQHLVPINVESKFRLLGLFGEAFGREDLVVNPVDTGGPGHQRIWTENTDRCQGLWEIAGRDSWPTIEEMIQSLAKWESRAFPALGVPA